MYTKVIQSGNLLEVYQYEKAPLPVSRRPRKKAQANAYKRPRNLNRRRGDNVLRLSRGFIRLVRANLGGIHRPAFITLTFERDIPLGDAWGCLSAFAKCCRRNFGEAFRYIAVPEFQKRGTIHFHLLAWGLDSETIANERYNRTLQNIWALGYVDCIATDGSPKLAGYIGKYMRKGMLDARLSGSKAYSCFGRIVRPVLLGGSALPFANEIWGIDLSTATPLRERAFSTQWLGEAKYRSYQLEM